MDGHSSADVRDEAKSIIRWHGNPLARRRDQPGELGKAYLFSPNLRPNRRPFDWIAE